MKIPLGTRFFKDRSLPASSINLINLYTETKAQDNKSATIVRKVPGLPLYLTAGNGPIRGMHKMDGVIYVVSGNTLYSITNGVATSRGTILGKGKVGMASNDRDTGPQLVITNGTATAYIYTVSGGLSTTTLTGPAYTVTYQDGYFIYDWAGTGKWFISSVLDGTTYDSLETGATNSRPDEVLAVISYHQQIIVFGTETREHFYNSGNLDFPFIRISEATDANIGLGARWSLLEMDNTLYWVGSDREVYRNEGYVAKQISDPTVSQQLKNVDLGQVTAFTYTWEGHKFYQLNLEDKSLVFDARENVWHQKSRFNNGVYSRNRGDCHCYFEGLHLIGDYKNGNIYQVSESYHYDAGGEVLRWEMVLPPIHNEGERLTLKCMELDFEQGVGKNTGQGSDPQVFMTFSEDARTWSNEVWVGIGKIGKYKNKAVINRLGSTDNQFIYRWAGSDPVPITILNCYVT